jgi:hypothetical protein
VTDLDFGSGVFNGEARWLEISVQCPTGSGDYTTLTPRQALTPAPYALALPGLRTQPNDSSPNLIGGYSVNSVADGVSGATISGGGAVGGINLVTADWSTIGGGASNTVSGIYAAIGGGSINTASGDRTTISGGYYNYASWYGATIGGGEHNTASGLYATIAGGGPLDQYDPTTYNRVTNDYATLGGGGNNKVEGMAATIGGGSTNTASGQYATIPGGYNNTASGVGSFAAGQDATASHDGSFVWGDGSGSAFSTDTGQFLALAANGIGFYTSFGSCTFFSGSNWSCSSDRNLKENFVDIDEREILERLNQVSITRWNMKGKNPDIYHLGPVAQDFYAAFELGEDDKHINTGDAQGVAFAAIQGLYQVVQEKESQIAAQQKQIDALQQQNANLETRLVALEQAVGTNGAPSLPLISGLHFGWLLPLIGLLLIGLVLGQRWRTGER